MNQPLVVRAEMTAGVAIDRMFTLDGLLGAAIIRVPELREDSRHRRHFQFLCRKHGREAAEARYAERGWPVPGEHFLPLAAWGHGASAKWVYCASYGAPDEPWEHDLQYWNRRMDAEAVLRWVSEPPKKIETAKGPYKGYHMPVQLLVTSALTFHVCGDADVIRRILAEVPYFGKKRSQGYGRVRRWIVEVGEDRSVWGGDELRRPVPVELLEAMSVEGDFEYGYYAYRPPYHDSRNFTKCAIRGKRSQIMAPGEQKPICETDWAGLAAEAFGAS